LPYANLRITGREIKPYNKAFANNLSASRALSNAAFG
jgi:hypothetical protein